MMRNLSYLLLVAACDGPDDGGSEEDDDDAPIVLHGPQAILIMSTSDGDLGPSTVSAGFYSAPGETQSGTAPDPELDTCVLRPADATTTSTGSTTFPGLRVSGGDVTVAFDGEVVDLGPMGSGTLTEWPAGQTASFASSGGEIPAFDVSDLLVVPDPVEPVGKVDEADGSIALTWGGDPGVGPFAQVSVGLLGEFGYVFCLVADDGAFRIEADDLAAAGRHTPPIVVRMDAEILELPGVQVTGEAFASGLAR